VLPAIGSWRVRPGGAGRSDQFQGHLGLEVERGRFPAIQWLAIQWAGSPVAVFQDSIIFLRRTCTG